jgi:hypothetical protein
MALDGMNVWYEARLFEGAIEDVESLCSASLVDLVLVRTAPTARLVDWIDQGMLRIHTDASSLDRLRRLGIRTATDLLRVVNSTSVNVDVQDVTVPLETIRSAVQGEPNLFHVSAWKERATVATAPPAESP